MMTRYFTIFCLFIICSLLFILYSMETCGMKERRAFSQKNLYEQERRDNHAQVLVHLNDLRFLIQKNQEENKNISTKDMISKNQNDKAEAEKITEKKLSERNPEILRFRQQQLRLAKLREFCKNRGKKIKYSAENLLYNHNKTVIYCSVPKVACTNWKRFMLYFDGKIKHPMDIKDKQAVHYKEFNSFAQINHNERLRWFNIYYSFLIVRHPFERLLSAYRDKFSDSIQSEFKSHFGAEIRKLVYPNITKDSQKSSITFDDFLNYVIYSFKNDKPINEHWQRMTTLCTPCLIKYNFIGKMDTLVDDSNSILDDLDVDKNIRFPTAKEYKVDVKKIEKNFYSNISNERIREVYEIFKNDFDAFGYDIPDYLNGVLVKTN